MNVINFKKNFLSVIVLFFVLFLVYFAHKVDKANPLPKLVVSKEQSAINLKSNYVNLLSFGHARLISSILWITTLIEGDLEHYKGSGNSWMYHRFLTISMLEPKFYHNYVFGGQYLSIVKDDIFGADTIYSLGTRIYPDDFKLNYNAGFNAAFEIGDYKLALTYYNKIYDHPWTRLKYPSLFPLINKLRIQVDQIPLSETYDVIYQTWSTSEDENIKNILGGYLYAIKAQIDLECLNSSRSSCSKLDFDGNSYMKINNDWVASKPWTIFKIFKNKKKENL